jgi:N-acetylneuraminic acid mutarotase
MSKKLIPFLIVTLLASTFLAAFQFPVVGAAENSWTTMKAMPTARGGLGVAVVNGKIYAIGGSNNNTQLDVNEEYNPVTDTWTTKTPMPTARSGFAIAVYQNKIYCIGGTTGYSDSFVSGFTGVTEVYDPATNTWETTKTPMPTPRADLCASVVNGVIYCIGGKKYWGVDPFYQELNVTEAYDPAENSWSKKSPMPIPVLGCTSAVLDGKIFVIGGSRHFQLGGDLATVGSNQVYDPENDAWSTRTSLPITESYAAADATSGVTAPKKIYVVGGFNETDYSSVTYVYDSKGNVWSTGTSMPTSRAYLALAIVDDILYAIGGFDGEDWLNVNEQYMPIGYGTVPPELQVLSPENKTYTSNDIQLVLSVNKPTVWMRYSLDDRANVTVTGDTELSGVSEGAHSIVVYVNDTFGNIVASSPVYFSVDTVPPRIVVLSPKNGTYGENDIHSTFTVNEPVSWMGYSLDGRDNVTVTGNATLAVLADGSHNVTFYAVDLVGNTGASRTVYFEIAPFPTVLVVAVAVTITITVATAYLFLKRKKTITTKTQK